MIAGGSPTIYVSDMDAAVGFYTGVLGLRLEFRAGDHWASIDAGAGLRIGLHPAGEQAPQPGTAGSITIGLLVDEPIEAVVAQLTGRGVSFAGPVRAERMLKLAFFHDPDGNELYLAEPARWGG
jgi:catechol 2,3-dioxygenase-like lactoylglutathione lyase family enzyme